MNIKTISSSIREFKQKFNATMVQQKKGAKLGIELKKILNGGWRQLPHYYTLEGIPVVLSDVFIRCHNLSNWRVSPESTPWNAVALDMRVIMIPTTFHTMDENMQKFILSHEVGHCMLDQKRRYYKWWPDILLPFKILSDSNKALISGVPMSVEVEADMYAVDHSGLTLSEIKETKQAFIKAMAEVGYSKLVTDLHNTQLDIIQEHYILTR
jgi:hypothetical protein